ncbi:transposase [Aeromonas caviae]|uniref:transposase n=2 Tax=Gammaproteobacteria TaxID=1236 RepID=UPI0034E57489
MSDDEAFSLFKSLRWGDTGTVTCPCCGVVDVHYFIRTRNQWRCKDCKHTFSVTSGTI